MPWLRAAHHPSRDGLIPRVFGDGHPGASRLSAPPPLPPCPPPPPSPAAPQKSLSPLASPRLIRGLASENVRWAESVEMLREQEKTLCGDVLLVSAFVSYVGYFTKKYRAELLEKHWIPFLSRLAVSGHGSRPAVPGLLPSTPAGTKGLPLLCGQVANGPTLAGAHPHHPRAGSPQPPHRHR